MKAMLLSVIAICWLTCVRAQTKFPWLTGTWKLEGKELYEIWAEGNDGITLNGNSYKVNNGDTLVLEKIILTKIDNAYYYIPEVAENSAPVKFKITSSNAEGFTAENAQHDFPKMIKYTIVRKANSQSLEASISGNGKVISYTFFKIK